ncbi:hypothetical protein C8Q80DRAFT_1276117 [Daedaleopsis nitida]|nr:hypothetical protein C8Q80DRAFT_1276117 [Daedaleopsis nitida]
MDRSNYYRPRNASSRTRRRRTQPAAAQGQAPQYAPPPPPPPPPPPRQQVQEPQQEEGEEDNEPAHKRPRTDIEPEDEEWAEAIELLDSRASSNTMLANGYKHLYDEVRNITRLCGGDTANYANILSKGIEFYDIDLKDPEHPYWACEDYDDVAEATLLFPIFLRYFPGLEQHIDYLAQNNTVVQKLAHFCSSVAKKSRGDDVGRVKRDIVRLAQWEDPRLSFKGNRGHKHRVTGKLLMPTRLLDRFEATPDETNRLICKNKLKVYSEDWPMLLYDMALFRKGQQKPGLLKSHLLLEMGKSMFTGISSTDAGAESGTSSGKGQPSVAKKHGMEFINIHAILYVVTLVRFGCTSHGAWEPKEGKAWDVHAFMDNLLTFAHNNADWVDDIEGWWTQRIFGDGDEEDDETRAERQQTSFHLAMATECTGRRRPPAPSSNGRQPSSGTSSPAGPSGTHHSDED